MFCRGWLRVKTLLLAASLSGCGALSPAPKKIPENAPSETLINKNFKAGKIKWRQFPIDIQLAWQMSESEKIALRAAAKSWEIAVGRPLFNIEEAGVSNDSKMFSSLYSSLLDMVNGLYFMDTWQVTEKEATTIATTIWKLDTGSQSSIATADILFNLENYVFTDAHDQDLIKKDIFRHQEMTSQNNAHELDVVDLESAAVHELGHLLGLPHLKEKASPEAVMTPEMYVGKGISRRILSANDIRSIQSVYGCAHPACDIEKIIANVCAERADASFSKVCQEKMVSADLGLKADEGAGGGKKVGDIIRQVRRSLD